MREKALGKVSFETPTEVWADFSFCAVDRQYPAISKRYGGLVVQPIRIAVKRKESQEEFGLK